MFLRQFFFFRPETGDDTIECWLLQSNILVFSQSSLLDNLKCCIAEYTFLTRNEIYNGSLRVKSKIKKFIFFLQSICRFFELFNVFVEFLTVVDSSKDVRLGEGSRNAGSLNEKAVTL